MKIFTSLSLVVILSSTAAIAQELNTNAVSMQRRSIHRPAANLPGTSPLQAPGIPATRDYTRPVTNNSLNSASANVNPSLTINPVVLNRRPAYSSIGYQTAINNQQNQAMSGIQLQNSGLLNTLVPAITAIPSVLIPGLPVNLPTLPSIVNPIVPIVAPIVNPVLPIITPVIPGVINPVLPIVNPVLPIVNPILPIINPILPIKLPGL